MVKNHFTLKLGNYKKVLQRSRTDWSRLSREPAAGQCRADMPLCNCFSGHRDCNVAVRICMIDKGQEAIPLEVS